MGNTAVFTLTEILSLLGLTQSLYVMVYMVLRSGNWKHAILPLCYFASLSLAFLSDAAARIWQGHFDYYALWQWLFWFSGIPLGTLLIFQIAQTPVLPRPRYYLLLLFIPLSFLPGLLTGMTDVLYIGGLIGGACSLLAVWIRRDLMDEMVLHARFGGERFWLILSMIATNTVFLAATLAYASKWIGLNDWILIRTLLGIAFVYIAATSLLRIYPQAITIRRKAEGTALTNEDHRLLQALNDLLEREKVYQEADLGRAELARELGVGEANLSRIVNLHYGKTIPQVLNDYRVKDAQKLLKDTDVPINAVFAESGFSSMTTFNRVFKELSGESPKEYRARFRLI